jgi:hypothetical protein
MKEEMKVPKSCLLKKCWLLEPRPITARGSLWKTSKEEGRRKEDFLPQFQLNVCLHGQKQLYPSLRAKRVTKGGKR